MKTLMILLLASITTPVLASVSVSDFMGRTVTLDAPAQRIIALAPHVVENAFSAGAGDRLVGVVEYSDYPEAAKQIHRVGNYTAWSMEEIVALQPDLVLMWASGNGMHRLEMLERMGLTVYVSEPRQLTDVPATIRAIGHLAGTDAVSQAEAKRLEQRIATLRNWYGSESTLSVFYQVWNQPLQTINGDHLISHVIELCGGRNIYANAGTLAPKVNIESVLERDPQVIMASGMGSERPEWLDAWRDYPSISAVQHEALFFVHPDLLQRPTARVLEGATRVCEQLQSLRERSP